MGVGRSISHIYIGGKPLWEWEGLLAICIYMHI